LIQDLFQVDSAGFDNLSGDRFRTLAGREFLGGNLFKLLEDWREFFQ
jgi:hypothetical protein